MSPAAIAVVLKRFDAPGWKWSLHVGPIAGAARCEVEHVGMVLSGVATVPHDSWVVGNERYVSLHLLGAERYARKGDPR